MSSKNHVIPYAIIAVVGILAVIFISVIGVNQREEINNAAEGGEEQAEGGEVAAPEEIFEKNCAMCHGSDLSGGSAPDLTKVGNDHSADEIKEIIIKGTDGGMPGGLVGDEEAAALAEWLGEKK